MIRRRRFRWVGVHRRISTWLATVSAMATGALAAFALMPQRAQDLFPDWGIKTLAYLAVGAAALIPVATSFRQRRKPRAAP